MTEEQLKPCPFCGSEAQTDFIDDIESYIIECYRCGVRTASFDNAAEAVEAWNRREQAASAAPVKIDIERMQEALAGPNFPIQQGATREEVRDTIVQAARAAPAQEPVAWMPRHKEKGVVLREMVVTNELNKIKLGKSWEYADLYLAPVASAAPVVPKTADCGMCGCTILCRPHPITNPP